MTDSQATTSDSTAVTPARIALLRQRGVPLDEAVASQLEEHLRNQGHSVFVDRPEKIGVDWARDVERQIRGADAVIPLLSRQSVESETMGFEVEYAHTTAVERGGRPVLMPVRIDYTGPLVQPMTAILESLPYVLWEGDFSNPGLFAEIEHGLETLPNAEEAAPAMPAKGARLTRKLAQTSAPETTPEPAFAAPAALESVGGAVPLRSQFYVERPVDHALDEALAAKESVILVKGSRQMGKTSLLARGLAHARHRGARAVFTDLQKLNARDLQSAETLYHTLGESLADQLEISALPSDGWDRRRSANINFERYLRGEILLHLRSPLIWGLDEVDRLFSASYSSEVFGLFRSWHNERALDPSGPWSNFTLLMSYATEAHLFITDLNQSPFNVGVRLEVEDFTQVQVLELSRRYGNPIKNLDDVNRLTRLLGGHPYLIRRALHELATRPVRYDDFEAGADREEGIFGDHLRRMLVMLAMDPALTEVVRGVLHGEPCPSQESFYRLRSAGVLKGTAPNDAHARCRLYATYLKRHLL